MRRETGIWLDGYIFMHISFCFTLFYWPQFKGKHESDNSFPLSLSLHPVSQVWPVADFSFVSIHLSHSPPVILQEIHVWNHNRFSTWYLNWLGSHVNKFHSTDLKECVQVLLSLILPQLRKQFYRLQAIELLLIHLSLYLMTGTGYIVCCNESDIWNWS